MKMNSLHLLSLAGSLLASASLFAQSTPGGPNAGNPNPAGIVPGAGRPGSEGSAVTPSTGTPTTPPTSSTGSTTVTRPTTPTTGTTPPATGTPTTTPTTGPTRPTTPPTNLPPRPSENASERAKEVTALVQQFDANRDKVMAERAELMKKLEAAKTEAEKQAILTDLRNATQAERDEQAKLGKQIREQLKGAGRRPGS